MPKHDAGPRDRIESTGGLPFSAGRSTGGAVARQQEARRAREAQEKAKADAKARAQEIRDRLAAQGANRSPVVGARADGKFHLSLIQMGQGDGTIMSTPAGKVILIDCGTNATDDEDNATYTARVQGELLGLPYLRNSKVIDIVILSHPDKDHYNRLSAILPNGLGLTAGTVYHSGTWADYADGATWATALVPAADRIKKVVLNEDTAAKIGENTLAGAPIPAATPTARTEAFDPVRGLIVHTEVNCEVALLAAGVAKEYVQDKDGKDLTNRASIVTLVTVFGKKVLISADATRSTERFIKDSGRGAQLKKVDYLQVGHHGSITTSSGQDWVDHLEPQVRTVISTGVRGHSSHHLPSIPIVQRWEKRFDDNKRTKDLVPHLVSAWKVDRSNQAELVPLEVYQPVYSTGSSGTQNITIEAGS
jgi:beta-lactamase superfamily II metal-dependent hydrolase